METYIEHQKTTLCNNNMSLTYNLGIPKCSNLKEVLVTITYNEVEQDILELCRDCARFIKADCRKHGYKVNIKPI